MNRVIEYGIVTLWMVSMSWLVARDVIPRWFAEQPPLSANVAWLEHNGTNFQYGIFGQDGVLKGTGWTIYDVNGTSINRTDYLLLDSLNLIGTLQLKAELTFLDETELDTVDIAIEAMQIPIQLKGERQGPQLAFTLKISTLPQKEFVLDAVTAQTLGDVIKPFSSLQDLEVGQSWKISVIDPFALIQNNQNRLNTVVATVVGRETIRIQGQNTECFIVESPGTRAWVDSRGRVLRQEVQLPGLGKIYIEEQKFNSSKFDASRRRIHGGRSSWRDSH